MPDSDSLRDAVLVSLRDDDLNRFTRPEAIHRLYGDLWGSVPIGFSVIPFHVGAEHPAIPLEFRASGAEYPVGDNHELVAFLKDYCARGWSEVMQHGCTHADFPDGFEFQAAPNLSWRLERGARHLEEVFGQRPRVFVPPHNALSFRGLRAVDEVGVQVLGSFLWFNPRDRPWDRTTLGNFARVWRYRRRLGRGRRERLVYPHVLRYARHGEFGCHDLVPGVTFEDLRAGLDEARAAGGNMCVATHFWELDDTLRAVLQRFLEHAAGRPYVRFVLPSALFGSTQTRAHVGAPPRGVRRA